jgi:hypothetical protein
MIYLLGTLGTVNKTINNISDRVESMTGILPERLKGKVQLYTGRGSNINNFGYAVNQLDRNMRDDSNNQSLGGNVR